MLYNVALVPDTNMCHWYSLLGVFEPKLRVFRWGENKVINPKVKCINIMYKQKVVTIIINN